jgi:hypothetical protein
MKNISTLKSQENKQEHMFQQRTPEAIRIWKLKLIDKTR